MLRIQCVKTCMFVLALLLSGPVHSGSTEAGFVAFKQGDKELAYKNWLPLAIQGDARTQFFLSVLYAQWTGSGEDRNNAKRWLTASANNDFIPAQFNLGNNYHQGKYGRANNKMAAYWWERAAVQGFVPAQYLLATVYYWGEGIELDMKESIYWFEKAANNGSQEARAAMMQTRAGTMERDKTGPVNIAYDDPTIVSQLPVIATDSAELPVVRDQTADQQDGGVAVVTKSPASGGLPGQDATAPALAQKELAEPDEKGGTDAAIDVKSDKRHEPELNWVEQQPAENRTIQLFASGRMQHCDKYAGQLRQRYNLETHAYAFIMKRKKLCAVVYGSYAKLSEARAGLRQLPGKIRRAKPWIRTLAGLQRLAR